jgi:hypothetical protein
MRLGSLRDRSAWKAELRQENAGRISPPVKQNRNPFACFNIRVIRSLPAVAGHPWCMKIDLCSFVNRADGISEIEGKAAKGSGERVEK